ncbi:hypothetical protein ACFLRW_03195 [Acidobacteriota bacterium]
MKKNPIKNKFHYLFILIVCILNIGIGPVSEIDQSDSIWGIRKSPLSLIYMIEFRDILCSPCSESFLDFCLSLPSEFQRENTMGIVVFDPSSPTHLEEKIVAKKVRGFKKGNRLHFPLFIDFSHIFKNLRTQATQLFILDSTVLSVKKYVFPLGEKLKNEIIQAVISSL